jgi:hypothetical protein
VTETEVGYLGRRAAEELAYADQCQDPVARSIHQQMAVLYANKVAELRKVIPLKIVEQSAIRQPSTSAL